eukprot:106521-Amphidinium_carterae.1
MPNCGIFTHDHAHSPAAEICPALHGKLSVGNAWHTHALWSFGPRLWISARRLANQIDLCRFD